MTNINPDNRIVVCEVCGQPFRAFVIHRNEDQDVCAGCTELADKNTAEVSSVPIPETGQGQEEV